MSVQHPADQCQCCKETKRERMFFTTNKNEFLKKVEELERKSNPNILRLD